MDVRHLRYFVGVAEARSVTRAANVLRVAQPALSRALQQLEVELGFELFVRTGRGVDITPAGGELLTRAYTILQHFDDISTIAAAGKSVVTGTVRLGLTPSLTIAVGQGLVSRCLAEFPKINLAIVEATSGYVETWLANGEIDLALINGSSLAHETIEMEQFCTDRLYFITIREDFADREEIELANVPIDRLILPSLSHGMRKQIQQALRDCGRLCAPILEVDSFELSMRLVESGVGDTILPGLFFRSRVSTKAFRSRILEPTISRKMVLAYSRNRNISTASKAILGMLNQIRDEMMMPPPDWSGH
jgi:LysR family transcriptional regulator, nitrogen assimilation regulatory protein